MSGEPTVTVIGNLTSDPELRFTSVSREFGETEGTPVANSIAYMVYTKPDCPHCEKTKDYFDSKGITYTAVDITEVPAALEYITADLGYSQAPVVVNNTDDEDHRSGLRRDKLVQAAMSHKAA